MKHIITIIAICLSIYAIAGFILWNWNPATWDSDKRSGLVFICVAMNILYPLCYGMYNDLRKN